MGKAHAAMGLDPHGVHVRYTMLAALRLSVCLAQTTPGPGLNADAGVFQLAARTDANAVRMSAVISGTRASSLHISSSVPTRWVVGGLLETSLSIGLDSSPS